MGERILYFWLRFRWIIVAGTLLVAVGGGALSSMFAGTATRSPSTSVPGEPAEEALVLAGGENALAACDGIEKAAELFACRVSLGARAPIVLDSDGTRFLVDGGWQGASGSADPVEVEDPEIFSMLAAGTSIDLDNDGFDEHVVGSGPAALLHVFSQNPAGGLTDTAAVRGLDGVTGVNLVLPIDADRDGWLDLVVSSTRSPGGEDQNASAQTVRGVDIFFNRGWESPGTFDLNKAARIATIAGSTAALFLPDHLVDGHVGDVDGDGELDIVLVDRRGGVAIHWGSTTPNWGKTLPLEFHVPIGVTGLDVGDVDGDGMVDLAVSYDVTLGSAFGNLCPVQLNGRPCTILPGMSLYGGVGVFLQKPARTFAMSENLSIKDIRNASDVALADIDANRSVDIVVSRETPDGTGDVTVYRASDTDSGGFVAGETIGTGAVSSLRAADLDGNGMPDIAMTGRGETRAQLWLNSNAAKRYLHLDLRGSGSLEAVGTGRSALGVRIDVTDIDNRTVTVRSDADQIGEGVLLSLPLTEGAWAGTEAVPQVTITFPLTGRILKLTNVATNERLRVDEPAK